MSLRYFYDISLKINGVDYSAGVESVSILTSIRSVYNVFHILYRMDEQKITADELFGQNDIDLTIIHTSENDEPLSQIDVTLISLTHEVKLRSKAINNSYTGDFEHPTISIVELTCIPKNAFNVMMTTVNLVAPEYKTVNGEMIRTGDNPPLVIIRTLIDDFLKSKGLIYNESIEAANKDPINQLLIPPMPFSSAIDLIDSEFGIFEGPLHYLCYWDLNFDMWDLAYAIDNPPKDLSKSTNKNEPNDLFYTVHLITPSVDVNEIINEADLVSGRSYYVYNPINVTYKSNSVLMKEAENSTFISKPNNDLYYKINIDLEKMTTNDQETAKPGLFNNLVKDTQDITKIYYHDLVKTRHRVYNRKNIGHEYSDIYARSYLSRKMSDMTKIRFVMDRNLNIPKLIRVGHPIELKIHNELQIKHAGKYMVSSSNFTISRRGQIHFTATAEIEGFRANIIK